jgi:ubiquitin C-terminal hydrolase
VNYLLRRFFAQDLLNNPGDLFGCPNCATKQPKGCCAVQEFYLKDLPQVFVIQLKRFKSSGFSYSKNSAPVRTCEEICLDKYTILDRKVPP